MRKRILIVAVDAILCAGGFAVAQIPPVSVSADKRAVDSVRTMLEGSVSVMINGVVVRADRAVIQGREVSLEGNVRMTFPSRFSVSSEF